MLAVVILAAGKGTRMKSSLPKVLHQLGSHSLVERVLRSTVDLSPSRQLVIVGYGAEQVRSQLADWGSLEFVEQFEQLGTGHAVQQVLPVLQGFEGEVLVLNGDVPLLRPQTLRSLLETHRKHQNAATLLTAQLAHPQGYGRVFCDQRLHLQAIIEDRDCTPEQRQNQRINSGVYCFRWSALAQILPQLKAENNQKEYYLTDAVNFLDPVTVLDVADEQEIMGINDRKQLATAETILQSRIKDDWMAAGVTLRDPASITIDEQVQIAAEVIIEPQTHLRGKTSIGAGSHIGPGSLIENSTLGEQVRLLYSVVRESEVGDHSQIGPYAHLRGQVQVGPTCRIGNFVELKQTSLGEGTKVAHLSYLGNATLGNQVNIGAGTITANYDGYHKHPTYIGDRTKTGANSVLVAPLSLGTDVTVAAGSTITQTVGDDALVIARPHQTILPGWRLRGQA
ncbi:MAG: bifunctional UDP-N-acetylglucosamine diphosphorylase/glucosamine-1-phosphate N-acetyltransferase GlmU [Acaryochloridaceae cyanobacterium SU_2_1]|nr:bifunctional UDP-N-acetylglucosamine diphosphorylase/glucosamine-1-phosphate N-acetyltransferase GlmU [Acaryochloridaceae cyanobacterium SU_2_1]